MPVLVLVLVLVLVGAIFHGAPVLLLSGELESLTPPAQAALTLPGGQISASWPDRVAGATAHITGMLNGRRIVATMTAP